MDSHRKRLMTSLFYASGGRAGAIYDRSGTLLRSGRAPQGKELAIFPHLRRKLGVMQLLTKLNKLERLNQVYSTAKLSLITELKRRNDAWMKVADKALFAAREDVRAYCLSWRAAGVGDQVYRSVL